MKQWSSKLIEKLKLLVNKKLPIEEISSLLGRSIPSVYTKLSDLKIKSLRRRYFTSAEEKILIENFQQDIPISEISIKLNRNKTFLHNKAKQLGLVSKKRTQILKERRALEQNGKRKCSDCHKIYDDTPLNFGKNHHHICKLCNALRSREHYQSLKSHISVEELLVRRLYQAKYRSFRKGIEFNLSPDYLLELYHKQNGKCFYSGLDMEISLKNEQNSKTLSIDRIDSNKGYTAGNVVLCGNVFNVMKMQMSSNEFINMCGIVSRHIPSVNIDKTS